MPDAHRRSAADEDLRLLPLDRVAELLGVGRTTLNGLIASGELDSLLIGRRRLVPRAAVKLFLEARLGREVAAALFDHPRRGLV